MLEAQKAIIQGQMDHSPSGIYEIRAMVVVPNKATILDTPNSRLFLQGYWTKDQGYRPFGLAPIPMGEENTFPIEIPEHPENELDRIAAIRPRTLILEDQKVFRRSPGGWGPGDPDNAVEAEYSQRHLIPGTPFDFEAMWARLDPAVTGNAAR